MDSIYIRVYVMLGNLPKRNKLVEEHNNPVGKDGKQKSSNQKIRPIGFSNYF